MRFSSYALAVLAMVLVVSVNVQPAWSYITFTFTSGYGAGTTIEAYAGAGSPNPVRIGPRDVGGEGILNAYDGVTVTSVTGGSTGTAEAFADAASGRLGGLASADGWIVGVEGGGGTARSKLYDTYTISGPVGTSVDIDLELSLTGYFKFKTPGENPGGAQLIIRPRAVNPPYFSILTTIAVVVVSSQIAGVTPEIMYVVYWEEDKELSVEIIGTIDLDEAFQKVMGRSLRVGDSFIVEAELYVYTGTPSFHWNLALGPPFTTHFLDSGSLRPVSTTPGVSIISAAQQAAKPPVGVPEFEAPTMLLVTAGLLALLTLRRKPLKTRTLRAINCSCGASK